MPFFAFKDRRALHRGFSKALAIAKQYQLDDIIPRLNFTGPFGVVDWTRVADSVIHTYHTQYEDYITLYCQRYGHSPKYGQIHCEKLYERSEDGVICLWDRLCAQKYKVRQKLTSFRQGLICKFDRPKILRQRQLLFVKNMKSQKMKRFYWACRGFLMKNIQAVIALPDVLKVNQKLSWSWLEMVLIWMIWKKQAAKQEFQMRLSLRGWSPSPGTALYYKAADFFYFASTKWDARGWLGPRNRKWVPRSSLIAITYLDKRWSDPMFGNSFMKRAIWHKRFLKRLTRYYCNRRDQVGEKDWWYFCSHLWPNRVYEVPG